nr:hypothetical protein [Tanacetum cinerariifolium]
MDLTGVVAMTTTAAATTTTTLAVTTGIPVIDVTKETGVISPTDLQILFDDKIRAISAFPLDMCEIDLILDELPGIPPVHEVEFNIELIPGAEP